MVFPWAAAPRPGRARAAVGGRAWIGAGAWQREGKQRRRDAGEYDGVDQIGAAPADRVDQDMGGGPAHGRGESANKGERGDRTTRRRAEDAPKRGEGGI